MSDVRTRQGRVLLDEMRLDKQEVGRVSKRIGLFILEIEALRSHNLKEL